MHLLLLSNSTNHGDPYLHHASDVITNFLGTDLKLAFVPYAGVTVGYDDYEAKVQAALPKVEVTSVHRGDALKILQSSDAIAIGGGNTFQLLGMLQSLKLLHPIREMVLAGKPYIGWSAGSNIAGPTICTSNDMPIVQPASFNALNLVPFQINPHFTQSVIPNHGGESRVDRLMEYLTLNPESKVICMPEGTWFEQYGDEVASGGKKDLFEIDQDGTLRIVNAESYRRIFNP